MLRRITTLPWILLTTIFGFVPHDAVLAGDVSPRPNIVIILADDQGWGDLGVHGNTNVSTPHVDSLARDGALFDRFFVCPVCSPTRAEFLTGRYHPRCGVWNVSLGGERLNLDETTIADTFRTAGYATGAFGKWHNGSQYPYHPRGRGFDEFYGFCSGHWGDYFSPPLEHNGRIVRGNGFIIDDLTDHALAFIEQHRDKPFLCYLPYNTPHSPMQVPDKFYEKFKDAPLGLRYEGPHEEDVAMTRAALAMCENIDWNVGRVLEKLAALELADNTVVVYFSDNGPNSWRWNGAMKGRKGSTDEGGVCAPLLVRWPGHIKPGTKITQIASALDLRPTLAELAGVPIAPAQDKPIDGRSLAPLLLGAATNWPDRMVFTHWNGSVSVRTQQYRLDATGHLFDMAADQGQMRDLSHQLPDVAGTLSRAVADWKRELLADFKRDNRPFTVGYPEFPTTHLPSRDGVPRGNVRRSARAPNCSFFENWISTDDSMTWDVEVARAGRFEVVLYYTCPMADVGSTVEFTFRGSSLRAIVSQANDPPLRGIEHDRVVRQGESYVKDFVPLRLGVVELQPGRGPLTLQAVTVARKSVMDLRSIALTLVD